MAPVESVIDFNANGNYVYWGLNLPQNIEMHVYIYIIFFSYFRAGNMQRNFYCARSTEK